MCVFVCDIQQGSAGYGKKVVSVLDSAVRKVSGTVAIPTPSQHKDVSVCVCVLTCVCAKHCMLCVCVYVNASGPEPDAKVLFP